MRETFLHFLWRWRRFDLQNLRAADGQPLEILHPGELNTDAGPDFFNARIRLGDTEWAGNVEIHVQASEWYTHRHDDDPAYENVVLHVVYDNDLAVFRPNGEALPCLVLCERIPAHLLENYLRLEQQRAWIPCAHAFGAVPDIIRLNWYDRLLVERLEEKTEAVARWLHDTHNHWEEAFYRALAHSFGLKINTLPFEMTATSLPLLLLAKHKSSLFQLEALLFGQAGLLEKTFEEDYPRQLAREYAFLRHKYSLTPIDGGQWKFLRLRPANFPTVRLAQFAVLAHQSAHLFSQILDADDLRSFENLFEAPLGGYWETHYRFDKTSTKRRKTPGRDFVHLLLINTVAPFLFHYGKTKQQAEFQDKALRLLEQLPAEHNTVLDGWAALGVRPANAYYTQALLQLKTQYCDAQRCLECAVGNAILR